MEEAGYLVMSLSFLFMAPVFANRSRLESAVRWIFIIAFILVIVSLVGKVALVTGASRGIGNRMAACMAYELREHNVTAVSLYPGLVRTESVMRAAEYFDLSNSESPQFIGRAVAALAADPGIIQKSGKTLVAAALAQEYGFTDVDGKQPRVLTVEEA